MTRTSDHGQRSGAMGAHVRAAGGAIGRPLAVLSLLLVVSGCGTETAPTSAPPQTLTASALPKLDSRVRSLDRRTLAADALQPSALADLLAEAGYVAGREREFSGRSRTFNRVVARTLLFEREEGGERYLDWLKGHGRDLLGRAVPVRLTTPGRSGVALTLVPCGACKNELPTFLAGWRRGATVLSVLAAGPGVNPERFSALVREQDEAGT
jgi:hypothetical protein